MEAQPQHTPPPPLARFVEDCATERVCSFQALGHTFQLQAGPSFGAWPYFVRDGVHDVLCGAVECCWQTSPVDMIHSLEEDRDMSLYSEISISFRPDDGVHIADLERCATMSRADYRAFLRAFIPVALPLSRFGLEHFEREIPQRLRDSYRLTP